MRLARWINLSVSPIRVIPAHCDLECRWHFYGLIRFDLKATWKSGLKRWFGKNQVVRFGQETFSICAASKTPRLGAALAYYTVFAIPPLFLIALGVSSIWFDEQTARKELFGQLHGLIGTASGKAIEEMISAGAERPKAGLWATVVATVTILVTTTGVFVELQDALNTVWDAKPSKNSGLFQFIRNRLISFGMVLGVGFLLLVSLVLSAALAAFGGMISTKFGGYEMFWKGANFGISLLVITLLFAMIFKFLPDIKIGWRDVWFGGFLTALLFNFGKFLLSSYLGRSEASASFGAAGSLVIILLWVYYSAQILFFGAAVTRVHAGRRKSKTGKGNVAGD